MMSELVWTVDLSKPLSHSFTYDLGDHGWGNEELQNYTDRAENAFVNAQGDAIVIRAIAREDESRPGSGNFTSARLVSRQCLQAEQGYVEAEIRAPHAQGIWYAFWLLPKPPFAWPSDGEVDIAEGWDGKRENGNCLHWGHFNAHDHDKHRVRYHPVSSSSHTYGLCWSPRGLIWYFDGAPTMHAHLPPGIRPMPHFQIVLNIAMGGNVMAGSTPVVPSRHEMTVRRLAIYHAPPGGWENFDQAWAASQQGNTM